MTANDPFIARSPATASRRLGDETIIMSTVDSTLFSLNSTGTAIWQGADGTRRLSAVVGEHVCPEFSVDLAQATSDAAEFVASLAEHGILLVSDEPILARAA